MLYMHNINNNSLYILLLHKFLSLSLFINETLDNGNLLCAFILQPDDLKSSNLLCPLNFGWDAQCASSL
jgi:hypothetical protein